MQELINYIKSERAKGTGDADIIAALKSAGWDGNSVTAAMQEQPPASPVAEPVAAEPKWQTFLKNNKKYIGAAAGVIILIAVGFQAYSFFVSNPEKVWADSVEKMGKIKSVKFKVEGSFAEQPPQNSKNDFSQFFGQGGELKLSATGQGSMIIKKDASDADYDMTSTLTVKFGTITVSFDFESRKLGDSVYYKIEGNPLLSLLGGLGEGTNETEPAQWLKINLKQDYGEDFALTDIQKAQALDAFNKAKVMKPIKLLGTEDINSKSTWHYSAELDKNELKNYLKELEKIFSDEGDNSVDLKNIETIIEKLEFKKLEVWIGRSDHLIYQILIETNAPSVFSGSMNSATAKARDAKRMADVQQIRTALELFYNENGRYPAAENGQVSPNDGQNNSKFSNILAIYPATPTPPDGGCSENNNKYIYEQIDGGKSYSLTYCLGFDYKDYKAGVVQLTPNGSTTIQPTSSGIANMFDQIPFDATFRIKLNLSDFNSDIRIEEPQSVRDVNLPSPTDDLPRGLQ
ncbi:MAG: hypothetical protein HY395_00315 [Candidatus Doudnabacteria bacterium]|nr:hypothetical protein [Candidatus Doudnabacteria bacterium]